MCSSQDNGSAGQRQLLLGPQPWVGDRPQQGRTRQSQSRVHTRHMFHFLSHVAFVKVLRKPKGPTEGITVKVLPRVYSTGTEGLCPICMLGNPQVRSGTGGGSPSSDDSCANSGLYFLRFLQESFG